MPIEANSSYTFAINLDIDSGTGYLNWLADPSVVFLSNDLTEAPATQTINIPKDYFIDAKSLIIDYSALSGSFDLTNLNTNNIEVIQADNVDSLISTTLPVTIDATNNNIITIPIDSSKFSDTAGDIRVRIGNTTTNSPERIKNPTTVGSHEIIIKTQKDFANDYAVIAQFNLSAIIADQQPEINLSTNLVRAPNKHTITLPNYYFIDATNLTIDYTADSFDISQIEEDDIEITQDEVSIKGSSIQIDYLSEDKIIIPINTSTSYDADGSDIIVTIGGTNSISNPDEAGFYDVETSVTDANNIVLKNYTFEDNQIIEELANIILSSDSVGVSATQTITIPSYYFINADKIIFEYPTSFDLDKLVNIYIKAEQDNSIVIGTDSDIIINTTDNTITIPIAGINSDPEESDIEITIGNIATGAFERIINPNQAGNYSIAVKLQNNTGASTFIPFDITTTIGDETKLVLASKTPKTFAKEIFTLSTSYLTTSATTIILDYPSDFDLSVLENADITITQDTINLINDVDDIEIETTNNTIIIPINTNFNTEGGSVIITIGDTNKIKNSDEEGDYDINISIQDDDEQNVTNPFYVTTEIIESKASLSNQVVDDNLDSEKSLHTITFYPNNDLAASDSLILDYGANSIFDFGSLAVSDISVSQATSTTEVAGSFGTIVIDTITDSKNTITIPITTPSTGPITITIGGATNRIINPTVAGKYNITATLEDSSNNLKQTELIPTYILGDNSSISLDEDLTSAPGVQTITFTPFSTLSDNDEIILTYPDDSFDWNDITTDDVTVTQGSATFEPEDLDSFNGIITIPVPTVDTGDITVTVGTYEKMLNPYTAGLFPIKIQVKDSTATTLDTEIKYESYAVATIDSNFATNATGEAAEHTFYFYPEYGGLADGDKIILEYTDDFSLTNLANADIEVTQGSIGSINTFNLDITDEAIISGNIIEIPVTDSTISDNQALVTLNIGDTNQIINPGTENTYAINLIIQNSSGTEQQREIISVFIGEDIGSLSNTATDALAQQSLTLYSNTAALSNNGSIIFTYDDNFDLSFLTGSDITVTQTNGTYGTPTINANTITIPITTPGTGPVHFTIGDTANKAINPDIAGNYEVAWEIKNSGNFTQAQSSIILAVDSSYIYTSTVVSAENQGDDAEDTAQVIIHVAEAIILDLNKDAIELYLNPAVNNGLDSENVVANVRSNLLGGYILQTKLNGNKIIDAAQLDGADITNDAFISSGNPFKDFNVFGYIGYDGDEVEKTEDDLSSDSNEIVQSFSSTYANVLKYDGINTLGYLDATNSQDHTLWFVGAVDFSIPADDYEGTLSVVAGASV
jgi:hypothetical protein